MNCGFSLFEKLYSAGIWWEGSTAGPSASPHVHIRAWLIPRQVEVAGDCGMPAGVEEFPMDLR